jgi:hypothetical protein
MLRAGSCCYHSLKQGALLAWRGRIPTFGGMAGLEPDLAFLVPKMTPSGPGKPPHIVV